MIKGTLIPMENIRVTFFVRVSLNSTHVTFLRDLYMSDEPVEPIVVCKLSREDSPGPQLYELIDGRHRIEAAKQAGYYSIRAKFEEFKSEEDKVLNAVLANVGGSLPPTPLDFEHSLELLMKAGVTKKAILENFPLPQGLTSRYLKLAKQRSHSRLVRSAVDAVLIGNITMKEAAEKYKVELTELKAALARRESGDINVSKLLSEIEHASRSLGQQISKKAAVFLEAYEMGEISHNDLIRLQQKIKSLAKSVASSTEGIDARIRSVLNPPLKAVDKEGFRQAKTAVSA